MKIADFFSRAVKWVATDEAEYPYKATLGGELARVRLNDFPAENLYTLMVGGASVDFDEWPAIWTKVAKRAPKITRSPNRPAVKAV